MMIIRLLNTRLRIYAVMHHHTVAAIFQGRGKHSAIVVHGPEGHTMVGDFIPMRRIVPAITPENTALRLVKV